MARSRLQNSGNSAAVDAAVKRAAASGSTGARICVALSGGVDSVVLLHAVATQRDSIDAPWVLLAHHVHHGLSPNADAWVSHCQAICASLDVPFTIERVHVDRDSRMGVEAAARAARYASLDKVDAHFVLLAHHARDQAETVLLQLLRGAGASGLAAMPGAAGRYIRPLLGVSKNTITKYAESRTLTWVDDESNVDVRFARNRLRKAVWPELVRAFPSAEVTLSRAASHQADAAALLEDLAAIDAVHCVANGALRLTAFNALSRPRKANVFRYWLAKSNVNVPATETLREWLQQLASVEPTQLICLPCAGTKTSIRVYRGTARVVPAVARWHAHSWRGEPTLNLQGDQGIAGRVTAIESRDANALRMPLDGENWTLRTREPGDSIELSPHSGRVAIKNIFQNAGVPPWQREGWPILTCGTVVVAVIGIATASAFRVHPGDPGVDLEWKPGQWKPECNGRLQS